MEENKKLKNLRAIIFRYMMNPNKLISDIEKHNELLNELNEKTIRIMKVSPIQNIVKLDEEGDIELVGTKFDKPTDELLKDIKKQNEDYLRHNFPDLYIYTDHLNENDGLIDESLF